MPEELKKAYLALPTQDTGILGNIQLIIAGGKFQGKIEGAGATPVVGGDVDMSIIGGDFSECPGIFACTSDGTGLINHGSSRLEVVGNVLDGYSGIISGGILGQENTEGIRKLVIGGNAGDLSHAKIWDIDKVEIEDNSTVAFGANLQSKDLMLSNSDKSRISFVSSSTTDEVGRGSTLELNDDAVLEKIMIYGEGELKIDDGKVLTVGTESQLEGVNLDMEHGSTLVLMSPTDEISSLNGTGTINFYETDLTISGHRDSFFAGDINGIGSISVNNGHLELETTASPQLALRINRAVVDLRNTPASFLGISLTEASQLTLGLEPAPCIPGQLEIGADGLRLESDACLNLHVSDSPDGPIVNSQGPIELVDGSIIKISGKVDTLPIMHSAKDIKLGMVTVLVHDKRKAFLEVSKDDSGTTLSLKLDA